MSCLFDDIFDVHTIQQLPLYIRVDELKGNIIYCRGYTFLHDIAWKPSGSLMISSTYTTIILGIAV
ncbi:MAG: hypothetical protein ACLFMM_08220 [Methanohalobium sp.]|uniref:hypothetical protein n=1 Tax=Methanohalobium sp. TaxID=2837493 RepID=UPI00397CDAA6